MGIQVKYAKGKGKMKVDSGGGGSVVGPLADGDQLLPIETDFYATLSPQVLFVGSGTGAEEQALWKQIRSYWHSACISTTFDASILHERYVGFDEGEASPESKESKLLQIMIGKQSRGTKLVKISPVACQLLDNVAIAVFRYSWEYVISPSNRLVREDGAYVQTWTRTSNSWSLLGESGGPVCE